MAHLRMNLLTKPRGAVGWDDVVDRFQGDVQPFEDVPDPFEGIFDVEDIDVALALVERNFDFNALINKRAGYLSVNAPKWTANRFEIEVSQADTQLVMDGLGVELTAVKDYRLLGELLQTLLDRLIGQVFDTQALIETVNAVLASKASTGKPFGLELRLGALGAREYRKARFLHCAEDAQILVDWAYRFISEWFPARLAKREDFYAFRPDTHAELYLKSFERWLHHQPDVFDGAEIQLDIFEPIELPESNAEQKAVARKMRADGATLKVIAEELETTSKTITLWCKGITPKNQHKETRNDLQQKRQQKRDKKAQQKQEVLRLYASGMLPPDIAKKVKVGRATIYRWIDKSDF